MRRGSFERGGEGGKGRFRGLFFRKKKKKVNNNTSNNLNQKSQITLI